MMKIYYIPILLGSMIYKTRHVIFVKNSEIRDVDESLISNRKLIRNLDGSHVRVIYQEIATST